MWVRTLAYMKKFLYLCSVNCKVQLANKPNIVNNYADGQLHKAISSQ